LQRVKDMIAEINPTPRPAKIEVNKKSSRK
jgi:hypothetical protein